MILIYEKSNCYIWHVLRFGANKTELVQTTLSDVAWYENTSSCRTLDEKTTKTNLLIILLSQKKALCCEGEFVISISWIQTLNEFHFVYMVAVTVNYLSLLNVEKKRKTPWHSYCFYHLIHVIPALGEKKSLYFI